MITTYPAGHTRADYDALASYAKSGAPDAKQRIASIILEARALGYSPTAIAKRFNHHKVPHGSGGVWAWEFVVGVTERARMERLLGNSKGV